MSPLSSCLLLLLLLLPAATPQQCHQEISFKEILQKVQVPACLAAQDGQDCSLYQRISALATQRNQTVENLLRRASVMILASKKYEKALKSDPKVINQVEEATVKHLGFIGVTRCLLNEQFCQSLRQDCSANFDCTAFLASGHCSNNVSCVPVWNSEFGQPSVLLTMPQLLQFRLLERQLFIAKELGDVQLSVSQNVEYLVQTKMSEAHSENFLHKDLPVVIFVAPPRQSAGYHHLFNLFMEAVFQLKQLFAFHVVTAPLSKCVQTNKTDCPAYRREFHEHEGFLGIYTQGHCGTDASWALNCEPKTFQADRLLTTANFAGVLLHEILSQKSPKLRFPSFTKVNQHLEAFVQKSETFLLAVVPTEEELNDPLAEWEVLEVLVTYLSAHFSSAYFPVIVTKSVAIDLLKDANTGLDLEESLKELCYLIHLPDNAGYTILKGGQPIISLDPVVDSVNDDITKFRNLIRESTKFLTEIEQNDVPAQVLDNGHFVGNMGGYEAGAELRQEMEAQQVHGRIDAFVEQKGFNEVYPLKDILVIERSDELLRTFFDKAGADKPWLALFVVSWSPLCKAARSLWADVGQCVKDMEMRDVQLVKIDCFEANEICRRLEIFSYPTIAFIRNGKIKAKYSGPIMTKNLCLFGTLGLQEAPLVSQSEKESRDTLEKFLPLKSRVFVFEGKELPQELKQLVERMHPNEIFVHQRSSKSPGVLTANYQNIWPSSTTFDESLKSPKALEQFIQNGHLDSVFPCTWTYLPQALRLRKSIIAVFQLTGLDDNLPLLRHLRGKFSAQASICYLNVRQFHYLKDLIKKLSGLNLPAITVIAKTPGESATIYRLPLAGIKKEKLLSESTKWVTEALQRKLQDGAEVKAPEEWKPASLAHNFVEEVYNPNSTTPQHHSGRGSRRFSGRAREEAVSEEESSHRQMLREEPPPFVESTDSGLKEEKKIHEEL